MMSHPLAYAETTAGDVLRALMPYADRAQIAGSVRRRKPEVKDIEIVAVPHSVPHGFLGDTILAVEDLRDAALRLGRRSKAGDKYVQVLDVLGSGLTLDLFMVTPPAEWGPILAIRTGPAEYSQMLVTRLKGRLWRCDGGRVIDSLGRHVPCPTEEDFFAAAEVAYIEPHLRATTVTVGVTT